VNATEFGRGVNAVIGLHRLGLFVNITRDGDLRGGFVTPCKFSMSQVNGNLLNHRAVSSAQPNPSPRMSFACS